MGGSYFFQSKKLRQNDRSICKYQLYTSLSAAVRMWRTKSDTGEQVHAKASVQ